jgi:hypothetical protein
MFTILTRDSLFYISPPTSQALRLDAGCHQMLLPAMQLVRILNRFCCVVDRNHPQSHVGAFTAGVSFPQIQFRGTAKEICCSFRGFLIFVSLQTPSPHIITTLNNFHPFPLPRRFLDRQGHVAHVLWCIAGVQKSPYYILSGHLAVAGQGPRIYLPPPCT